jgi:hypothetical protein
MASYIPALDRGRASGIATLGTDGKVPAEQLPDLGGGGPHAIDGASHTAAGLTPGHVMRATAVDGFAFGALQDADLPSGLARDSEVAAAIGAHEAAADPHAGYQKEGEKGAANGYASLGADGIVPSAQLPPASGGSDPWTRVVLGADFQTSLAANTPVTGLNFTPAANKRYLVEVYLLLRTATATVGPRPGFSWPTVADGGAWMQAPNSATAYALRAWGPRNTQNAASTGVPDTTNSHLAIGGAYIVSGATPSGSFGVTLATETAGTIVRVMAGSVLMYREI